MTACIENHSYEKYFLLPTRHGNFLSDFSFTITQKHIDHIFAILYSNIQALEKFAQLYPLPLIIIG